MALGDDYITAAELKGELNIGDSVDDTEIALAVTSASRWVTTYCERDFNVAASATPRTFYPDDRHIVCVDDISSSTGLVIKTDEGDDGTYETTWASTDYQLEPLNQVVSGLTGWPYTRIRAVQSRDFPIHTDRAPVEVTAIWGWSAVPDAVKKATMVMASRLYKRRFSPEGVLGGAEQFGVVRVGTKIDPDVAMLLAPYKRNVFPVA